ncbi:hypothetical protein [Cupriavidus pampae]|uniref:Uncharacterized protein n=1 Tax=Cupriavidus pampae TaxID=659251 RepID=A0ABM8Y095_9BURK|nr:hypothetical protein [Cupriavidus pampae]CAG9186021.1 hypothetical protein LMG32289_06221 [Cupriavidus pampae]
MANAAAASVPAYLPVSDVLAGDQDIAERIDSVTFEYAGVRCHVFGVLHGLTGGTNRQYKALVERAIQSAPGELVFGETKFAKLYRGVQVEMDDWTEIPLRDAFRMQFKAALTPARLFRLAYSSWRERRTDRDRFGRGGPRRLQDIGGSAAFHQIAPGERRRLAGFPGPYEYLVENCWRRAGLGSMRGPVFPDPDWAWLAMIEPELNIPLRSVFMLEFATERARRLGAKEISLFVGEIHNSDMEWLASCDIDAMPSNPVRSMVPAVRERARALAYAPRPSRLRFVAASLLGAGIPLSFYYGLLAFWLL